MLVAISGSQGSGKTTIIEEIKAQNFNIIERKTSRSILEDWGVTLKDVNNDPDLTVRFQEEITTRKVEDEIHAYEDEEVWFTERTHADLFTYALVSLGVHNKYSDWLNEYYRKCMYANQIYDHVYYLKAGMFNVVHDGTRGSNHHYSRMVDLTMLDITQQMVQNNRLTIIETPNIEQRVTMITVLSEAEQGRKNDR